MHTKISRNQPELSTHQPVPQQASNKAMTRDWLWECADTPTFIDLPRPSPRVQTHNHAMWMTTQYRSRTSGDSTARSDNCSISRLGPQQPAILQAHCRRVEHEEGLRRPRLFKECSLPRRLPWASAQSSRARRPTWWRLAAGRI